MKRHLPPPAAQRSRPPEPEAPDLMIPAVLIRGGQKEQVQLAVPLGPLKYLRLPPPGANCPVCGLSRTFLNQLVLPCPENGFNPPVRSYVLKRRANCRSGVRLIDAESLFRYIEQHPAQAASQQAAV